MGSSSATTVFSGGSNPAAAQNTTSFVDTTIEVFDLEDF